VTLLNSCKICFLAQQSTTKSDNKSQDLTETEASTTTVTETDVQQFKQWLENYLKQRKLRMNSF
jgi:hypothetical protein